LHGEAEERTAIDGGQSARDCVWLRSATAEQYCRARRGGQRCRDGACASAAPPSAAVVASDLALEVGASCFKA
jgi:hypothetical protein